MKSTLLKKLLIGLCVCALIALPIIALPQNAQAATTAEAPLFFGCSLGFSDIFQCTVGNLLLLVKYFLGMVLTLVSQLIGWFIHYSTTIMSLPAVTAGFKVALGAVNVLFVMALIVMAFQIILGLGGHETKSKLAKVIVSAVLVNFSLLIAGFILDVSNVFTNFFISPVTGENFGAAFNIQFINNLTQHLGSNPNIFTLFAVDLFTVLLTGIALIIMIAVLGTVIVRTVYVAGLLIFMPIMWGFRVFPGLERYSSEWWDDFLKWGLKVLPVLTFFLWLGLSTASQLANFKDISPPVLSGEAGALGKTLTEAFNVLLQLAIVGGLMIYGLKKAVGEGGAISASATIGGAKKLLGLGGKIPGMGLLNRNFVKPAAGGASTLLTKAGNLAGIGGAFRGIAAKTAEYSHNDHDIEDFQKANLKGLSNESLYTFKGRNDIEKAAQLKELASRKKVGKFLADTTGGATREQRLGQIEDMAHSVATLTHKHDAELKDVAEIKEALEASPSLAVRLGIRKTIADQFKNMQPWKIGELDDSNFEIKNISKPTEDEGALSLAAVGNNSAAVKQIFSYGTAELKRVVEKGYADLNAQLDITYPAMKKAKQDLLNQDIKIAAMRVSGASKATLAPELRNRATAIQNIETEIKKITDDTERARVTGIINGEAVRRQTISRESGNVINP